MSNIAGALQALISMVCVGASGNEGEIRRIARQPIAWKNEASVAGTTALAERVLATARQKSRLLELKLRTPTAVTGDGTNYFTVVIKKRTSALPGTQVAIATFAADTVTTDNLVAFTAKDLLGYSDALAGTAFDLEEGDMLTVEVTKTGGSGLAFPIAEIFGVLEPRT